jgi:hypothetical protein
VLGEPVLHEPAGDVGSTEYKRRCACIAFHDQEQSHALDRLVSYSASSIRVSRDFRTQRLSIAMSVTAFTDRPRIDIRAAKSGVLQHSLDHPHRGHESPPGAIMDSEYCLSPPTWRIRNNGMSSIA